MFRLQYFIDNVYEGKIIAVLKFTLLQFYLGSINIMPQKLIFGNTTPEKSENAPTTGYFGFVFEESSFRELLLLQYNFFREALCSKYFPFDTKTKL